MQAGEPVCEGARGGLPETLWRVLRGTAVLHPGGACQRPLARQDEEDEEDQDEEDEEDEEECRRRHLKGLHLRWLEASPERVTSPAAERLSD